MPRTDKAETIAVAQAPNTAIEEDEDEDAFDEDEDYDEDEDEDDDFDPDEVANFDGVTAAKGGAMPVLRQGVEFPGEVKSAEYQRAKSSGRKQIAVQYRFTDASVGESTTVYEYLGVDDAGKPFLLARLEQMEINPNGKTYSQIAEEMEEKYVKGILGIQKKTKLYPAKNKIRMITASSDVPFDEEDEDEEDF